MKKLAIITTHPIQYHAPLYELLTRRGRIAIRVFYTWGESVLKDKFDPGFGKVIEWDIPLLKGYDYTFLENTADDKGSHHFNGIINPNIIGAVNDFKPDAIMVYGWSFKSHLSLMRYFKRKLPLIFRGDSTLLDDMGFIGRLKRKIFLRWVYRYVDTALYVGENNKQYFRMAGLKESQLFFGPHAVDNDRFHCNEAPCRQQAEAFRNQLGIPSGHAVFLFAGKLEPKKSPDLLISAFIECAFDNTVHLVLAGNGVLENSLRLSARSCPTIHFLEFQNQQQMPALYHAADVFVLPSGGPGETWGLAVNEAMASGKPVIVSDRCGCAPDLVVNGENGFVFASGRKESLKESLRSMMNKRMEWKRMGKESRQRVDRYSFSVLAQSIEDLTEKLTNNRIS